MAKWLDDVWDAANGSAGVSRRNVDDVAKYASEQELLDEAKKRGLHVAKIGVQYFIFKDAIAVLC